MSDERVASASKEGRQSLSRFVGRVEDLDVVLVGRLKLGYIMRIQEG